MKGDYRIVKDPRKNVLNAPWDDMTFWSNEADSLMVCPNHFEIVHVVLQQPILKQFWTLILYSLRSYKIYKTFLVPIILQLCWDPVSPVHSLT